MSDTETTTAKAAPARPTPRLKQRYLDEIRPALLADLGVNAMRLPKLEKIVVNVGLGEAVNDSKALEGAIRDLTTITGQKPRVNRARKSIANFKLREGMPIGVKVTLRGDRAWEFFDRLLSVAFPRIRDFRGMRATSFDGNGNYTFGLTEQLMFPEIDYDQVDAVRGMDITIVTTADNDEHGRAFLDAYGFPFVRDTQS
ncbi:MAG: 50S ribosomal protein L5 [Actinobacteria bacterium]|jgi:large subunit ribosomal protein L5|nr:50S ribosomal protein L5 [Actinomycetota bacterium]